MTFSAISLRRFTGALTLALSVAFSAALLLSPDANAQSISELRQSLQKSGISAGKEADVSGVAYNKLQFKFAHNSYERDETIAEMLEYDNKFKFQAGCRGIEFDCHQDKKSAGEKDAWRWSVHHDGEYSADKPSLESYLAQVKSWADSHPGHDPIAVYFEFKDGFGSDAVFAKKFDAFVLAKLAGGNRGKFYTPAEMLARSAGAKDLVSAAEKAGWPTLGELKGKFILVITGGEGSRKEYYSSRPKETLAFVDRDCGEGDGAFPSVTSGNRLFLNLHVYHKNEGWHRFCQTAASRKGFVVRGWKVNALPLWNDCVKYGLNMLATDKVKNHPWAYVGGGPFRKIALSR